MSISKSVPRQYYGRVSQAVSTLTTVPAPTAITGTVTTTGVRYTLSSANSVKPGDFIFNGSTEVRRVISIDETTGLHGKIDAAFTADLAAATVTKVLKETIGRVWAVDLFVTGTTSVIEGLTYPQYTSFRIGIPDAAEIGIQCPLQPIIVDGSASKTCNAVINLFK